MSGQQNIVRHYTKQAIEAECRLDELGQLADFTELLSACCVNVTCISSDAESRQPLRLETASNATVLHAGLIAGQRKDAAVAVRALRILGDRFLAARQPEIDAARDVQMASFEVRT